MVKIPGEKLEILRKPAYLETLLSIAEGKDYASSIADYLDKKQPTVSEQLKKLEELGLIKQSERGRAKKYEVCWGDLLRVFYTIVKKGINLRGMYFQGKDQENLKKSLREIVPPELVKKTLLKEYMSNFRAIGGKKKGFDELIFSFFGALNNLESKYIKKLVEIFKVQDKEDLLDLAHIMEFEIWGVEMNAITCYLELKDNQGSESNPGDD